jgi:Xaa-Pro aminopeptidase
MKRAATRLTALVVVMLAVASMPAAAQTPEEYRKRRDAVRAKMEPGSTLIARSPAPTGDAFKQDDTLYYLTGLEEPNVALVLRALPSPPPALPAGTSLPASLLASMRPETLFMAPPRALPAAVRDPSAPAPKLERPGFELVASYEDLQATLDQILMRAGSAGRAAAGTPAPPGGASIIYLDYARSRRLSDPLTPDEEWLKRGRDRGLTFTIAPVAPLVAPLRAVKSAQEIDLVRTAVAITAAAQREAMRAAAPGMYEYQLQSIIEHVFSINGATRTAFATNVGSGPNGIILHWSENSRQTRSGDMVVMDIGAEYQRYAADITRTIPVSGTFTPRQKAIYETVLRANEAAIEMIAPGVRMRDINAKVDEVLGQGLIALGLITDVKDLRKYYTHGLSHGVGLAVHDMSAAVLEPGVILTIEPGLYVPEEQTGVRIEDTVLVTATGREVLSAGAPKKVAEVEALMKERGIDYSRYLVGRQ